MFAPIDQPFQSASLIAFDGTKPMVIRRYDFGTTKVKGILQANTKAERALPGLKPTESFIMVVASPKGSYIAATLRSTSHTYVYIFRTKTLEVDAKFEVSNMGTIQWSYDENTLLYECGNAKQSGVEASLLSRKTERTRRLPRPVVGAVWSTDSKDLYYAGSLQPDRVEFAKMESLKWFRIAGFDGEPTPVSLPTVADNTLLKNLNAAGRRLAVNGLYQSARGFWGPNQYAYWGLDYDEYSRKPDQDLFVTPTQASILKRPHMGNPNGTVGWLDAHRTCYFGNFPLTTRPDSHAAYLSFHDIASGKSVSYPVGVLPPSLPFATAVIPKPR